MSLVQLESYLLRSSDELIGRNIYSCMSYIIKYNTTYYLTKLNYHIICNNVII